MRVRVRLALSLSVFGMVLLSSAVAQEWRRADGRDRATQFIGFVNPERLYWRPLALPGVQAAEFKQLSFEEGTGARTLLVRLPAGWRQAHGYHSADLEMFVIEGGISIGDKQMGRYSHAYFPAGFAHSFSTTAGATVLQWWGGAPDFVASATSRAGTRTSEAIAGREYGDAPTTDPSKFPRFRDQPFWENSPIRMKLLRRDATTGQMTYVVSVPGGGPSMSGEGTLPLWSSSATWQEGFLLAGDTTVAECLPPGQVAGSYGANGYFFRPAGIRSGGLSLYSDTYSIWLFRTGPKHWLTYHDSCAEPAVGTRGRVP